MVVPSPCSAHQFMSCCIPGLASAACILYGAGLKCPAMQGCVAMLGATAHCAPRQLATALPLVVPRLATLLTDPHPKVQSAAQQAFKVVRTPQLQQ